MSDARLRAAQRRALLDPSLSAAAEREAVRHGFPLCAWAAWAELADRLCARVPHADPPGTAPCDGSPQLWADFLAWHHRDLWSHGERCAELCSSCDAVAALEPLS